MSRPYDPYAPTNIAAAEVVDEEQVSEPAAEPSAGVDPGPLDAGDGYPETGSAADVIAWAGDDERRRGFAVAREHERPESKRRKTVLAL